MAIVLTAAGTCNVHVLLITCYCIGTCNVHVLQVCIIMICT